MGGTVTGDTVHRAVQACPARRTCADDGVVAEAWAAAAEIDPRMRAAFAWAANQRLANEKDSGARHQDDDDGSGRANENGGDDQRHMRRCR